MTSSSPKSGRPSRGAWTRPWRACGTGGSDHAGSQGSAGYQECSSAAPTSAPFLNKKVSFVTYCGTGGVITQEARAVRDLWGAVVPLQPVLHF
jgi:hypothetical protein